MPISGEEKKLSDRLLSGRPAASAMGQGKHADDLVTADRNIIIAKLFESIKMNYGSIYILAT